MSPQSELKLRPGARTLKRRAEIMRGSKARVGPGTTQGKGNLMSNPIAYSIKAAGRAFAPHLSERYSLKFRTAAQCAIKAGELRVQLRSHHRSRTMPISGPSALMSLLPDTVIGVA